MSTTTSIYEARAPNSLSVGSSEWGMVWYLHYTDATSYILCKLQGRDGNPERHPFCFYDTGSLHILYSLSEPNWCMVLGFVQPTTEGSTWDLFSYTSVGHTNFYIRKLYIYLRHLGYYNKDTTIYITGGDQVEEIQGYIHLGMQMPTICMNLFGFCPRYKQDLRVVGRLFVASAGVD